MGLDSLLISLYMFFGVIVLIFLYFLYNVINDVIEDFKKSKRGRKQ